MDEPNLLEVEFCGAINTVPADARFIIGREGDLILDEDNRFLHRHFLEIYFRQDSWIIENIGSNLWATVSGRSEPFQARLGPGTLMPLTCPEMIIRFTAGTTDYEVGLVVPQLIQASGPDRQIRDGEMTVGRISVVHEQRLLIVALAEPSLRAGGTSLVSLPTSQEAARRLGWAMPKFERKLDNVCEKLTKLGVKGLKGSIDRLASDRRARLVEYAMDVGMVSTADLPLLDVYKAPPSES
jgi:hypothetical protein